MEFFLVRHVETTGNYENRFAGITDTQYTQKGEKQFLKLTEALKEYDFDIIYSSPISRALKIAKKVSEYKDREVEIVKELSEMNFGIFENLTFQEVVEEHKEHWNKWERDMLNYKLPKGDSLFEFHHRIELFIDNIKNNDGKCLIVCHGGTIQSILTHLLGIDIEQRWHFHIPLGGLVKINYENDFGILKRLDSLV
ncbi:MAG: histidine phosphatase family protein [Eubacteriaceae bacterium]